MESLKKEDTVTLICVFVSCSRAWKKSPGSTRPRTYIHSLKKEFTYMLMCRGPGTQVQQGPPTLNPKPRFNKAWDQQIAYNWASDRWVMPGQDEGPPTTGFMVPVTGYYKGSFKGLYKGTIRV